MMDGDANAIVPIEGSGQPTHSAVQHSKMVELSDAPHGLTVSHTQGFNGALLFSLSEQAAGFHTALSSLWKCCRCLGG